MPPQDENTDWKELIVQMAIDYALPVAGDVITGLISKSIQSSTKQYGIDV
ncbi:hypothetical protein P9H08_07695 [Bacillus cereus]|nr:hypothetical protein [Bacillus cereus]MED3310820.1 hypothetical protein [Bacillus thuringiensis]